MDSWKCSVLLTPSLVLFAVGTDVLVLPAWLFNNGPVVV